MIVNSRAPKLLGDFGEELATYLLLLQGFEVAVVDHVGADLIAEREGRRLAVSVKTRLFRTGSREHRSVSIEDDHIKKLVYFADRFEMSPVVAYVLSVADHKVIRAHLPRVAGGYVLRFHRDSALAKLTEISSFGYTRLGEQALRPMSIPAPTRGLRIGMAVPTV